VSAEERRLPVVGRHGDGPSDQNGGVGGGVGTGSTRPDPRRLSEGWVHRFVAAGARADEMIALYRELGFEVVADPVLTHDLEDGCVVCFSGGGEPYRSIYTRKAEQAGTERSNQEIPMAEMNPTQVLREEHEQILQVAGALEEVLAEAASDAVYDRIGKCIRFIRLFADACHHGKEEDLLFPALEDEGLPHDTGPIAVMLHEHRLGRQFASAMAESIDAARSGDAVARRRLLRAGHDYVGLIRNHILKEDNVLFNMADQLVVGPRCKRLCAAYDETTSHTFDGCAKRELEELGREIVSGV